MDSDYLKKRILWAAARHAWLDYYFIPQRGATVRCSIFLPHLDGESHPDVEHVRRLFEATDRTDSKARPLGSVGEGPLKDVDGTWMQTWRIGACHQMATTMERAAQWRWLADIALWRSWQTVMQTAPSMSRFDASVTTESRVELSKEFNRLRKLKIHARPPYPTRAIVDSNWRIPEDPALDTHKLTNMQITMPPNNRKLSYNLRDEHAARLKLEKDLELERASKKFAEQEIEALRKELEARPALQVRP